jgi:hypothetical protein
MKPTIKVDRVQSVQEALELEALDVKIICTILDPIYEFNDNRTISVEKAEEIGGSLKKSHLCCELKNPEYPISFLKQINCRYVQFSSHEIISRRIKLALENEGIGIIYSDLYASYDSDPSWIMSPFEHEDEDAEALNASFYDIELLTDVLDSWNFLSRRCPEYPEELQVSDINELASHYPILIGLNYSIENIREITYSMQNIRGITFRIGDEPERNDIHCISYNDVISILRFLKNL